MWWSLVLPGIVAYGRAHHVLKIVVAVALLTGGWLGWYLGVQHGRGVSEQKLLGEHAAEQEKGRVQQEELRIQLDSLRNERDVARETVRALRDSLDNSGRLALEDAAELQLYRRIAGAEGKAGLRVDDVQIVAGETDTDADALHITLAQVRGRDRVAGKLEAAVVGERDGVGQRVPITPAVGSAAAITFDLRFFETLVIPLPAGKPASVDLLEIDVWPRQAAHKPFQHVVAWGEILRRGP